MTDSELHPYVELIAREARRPVVHDPAARERIMAAVRAEPVPRRSSRLWERLVAPRVLRLSPVAGSLLAAGLVGIGVIAGGLTINRGGRHPAEQVQPVAQRPPVSDTMFTFVFVAPQARVVSLVGDFNDWDVTKVRMVRTGTNGTWTVTLPLPAGRHLYSFVVDGTWLPDPTAPVAPDDGFGRVNSVKVVKGGASL